MEHRELDTVPLTIEKLVYGGDGLARTANGEVLFVPWTAPNDEILVSNHKKSGKPRLERLLQPSPDRVTARCDVFGVCGGCQWQHISPNAQREWKRRIVEESLQRLGGFKEVCIQPTWGSDELSWRYRNRVQWDFTKAGDEKSATLGYSKTKSNDVISFTDCHLISDDMNHLYQTLLACVQSDAFRKNSRLVHSLQRIEVVRNRQGECLLSIHSTCPSTDLSPWQDVAVMLMETHGFLKGVVHFEPKTKNKPLQIMRLYGEESLLHTLAGRSYRVSAGSFFQTNFEAAEMMVQEAFSWLPVNTVNLLDLYAGVGTFAIALHEKAKQVLAIESAGRSIEDARENQRLNRANYLTIQAGQVERLLTTVKQTFEAAILDPPRSGASPAVLDWLTRQVSERLLYISCNPTTLARDLKQLAASGWVIDQVQPLDMFPQTYHVETMVQLSRR